MRGHSSGSVVIENTRRKDREMNKGSVSTVHLTADGTDVTRTFNQIEVSSEKASKKIQSDFDSAAKKTDRLFASMEKFAAPLASGAGLAAIGEFMLSSSRAAAEEEVSLRKLDAVLKATGNTVGMTSGELKGFADEMQRLTFFDDGAMRDAESVLMTFRNVSGDVFKDTMRAAADMSTVMGGDLQSSVLQLGKAMNDPLQGITALRRVGVSFSQEQRQQIESLVESNRLFEAQAIILKEVNQEFGGASIGVMDSHAGRLNTMGDAWETMTEAVGDYINKSGTTSGVIVGITGMIERQTDAFEKHTGAVYGIISAVDTLADSLLLSARGWGMMYDEAKKTMDSPFFRAALGASGFPVDLLFPLGGASGSPDAGFSFGGGGSGGRGASRGFEAPGMGTGDIPAGAATKWEGIRSAGERRLEESFIAMEKRYQGYEDDRLQRVEAARKEEEEIERRHSEMAVEITEARMLAEYEFLDNRREAERQAVEEMKRYQQDLSGWWGNTVYGMYQAADGQFENIGRSFDRMIKSMMVRGAIFGFVNMLTGGTFGAGVKMGLGFPSRDSGGPVTAGQPYAIGRPEVFIPNQSGKIVPIGGSTVNTVNLSISFTAAEKREMSGMSDTQFVQKLVRAVRDDHRLVQMLTGKN